MTERRDPIVADALRRLDVPDHGPGFWADLEARLADEADAASRPTDTTESTDDRDDVEIVELRARRDAKVDRPRSLPTRQLVAAVLVIVALLVGISLLNPLGDEDSSVGIAGQPGATSTPTTQPPPATDVSNTAAAATDAAVAWLSALGAGDVDGAYAMLDSGSRGRLPRSEFDAAGLAEGGAAFRDVATRYVFAYSAGDRQAHVVTFVGQVEREGMVETDAFPVVVVEEDGQARIALEVTQFRLLATSDGSFDILAPPGASVLASVDGSSARSIPVDSEGRGTITPDVTGAGPHALTLVAVTDGVPVARAAVVGT